MPLKQRLRAAGLEILRFTFARLPRARRARRILLDCSGSAVAASYLDDLRQVFADDPRLDFFKVIHPRLPPPERERCLASLQCPEMDYRKAKYFPWDLVVMADHPDLHEEIEFQARHGVLRIPHGIGSKKVDAHDYLYGPRLYDKKGRLRYTCIFESSESRRDQFVAANPGLRGVISLVGDVRIDKLVKASERALRRTDEITRPAVLIASSWSENNLFEHGGRELLTEAAVLMDRYSFVLRPHPHMLKIAAAGDWGKFFEEKKKEGFVFSPLTEELGWLLAAVSIVICDDLSSLALYAAVLGKRILIVPSGSAQISAGSFPARLTKIVPNLTKRGQLRELLAAAMRDGPAKELATLATEINSRPGESHHLVRTEIYRLLAFAPRPTPQAPMNFHRERGLPEPAYAGDH